MRNMAHLSLLLSLAMKSLSRESTLDLFPQESCHSFSLCARLSRANASLESSPGDWRLKFRLQPWPSLHLMSFKYTFLAVSNIQNCRQADVNSGSLLYFLVSTSLIILQQQKNPSFTPNTSLYTSPEVLSGPTAFS